VEKLFRSTAAQMALQATFYVLAMVGHLKNGSPTFAQVPNRITNVEFIIVSPTIANTMLAVGVLSFKCFNY
jgi:carbamoylphosphate synthase large subunit